jgi:energy-coupling factor transporter ATP-binding protein EcfA2
MSFDDSFNARTIPLRDVANGFVENGSFANVKRSCHNILLGPRGSGKTTLLKMLTPIAWDAWKKRTGSTETLSFTAVYIPTDIHWHHQLLYNFNSLKKAPVFFKRCTKASVCNSVMFALIETFAYVARTGNPVENAEQKLCTELIKAWGLEDTLPAYFDIKLAIKRRVTLLSQKLNSAIELDMEDAELRQQEKWFDLEFLPLSEHAIIAFDGFYLRDDEDRWALCFDELELAPNWLQESLFKFPRSVAQKIYFKLATSPDPDIKITEHVTALNDVIVERLWNASTIHSRDFCSKIAQSVMNRKKLGHSTPERMLGKSSPDDSEEDKLNFQTKAYSEGSDEWELIREVASWDNSLRKLLSDNNIDPRNPVAASTAIRDTILRKVKPIASLRKKFVKPSKGQLIRRSRKTSAGYHGTTAIYDISDGNPRRLIRLLEELCDAALETNSNTVSPQAQSRVVLNIAYLYVDYLQMIPSSRYFIPDWNQEVDIYTIIREIGRHFSADILLGPFPLDPNGTFTVDSATSQPMIELLRVASYHGAIVKIDPSVTGLLDDIRGKRYRLCYTLSPIFQMPLRLYAAVSLKSCLERLTQNPSKTIHLRPASGSGPTQLTIGGI